MNRKRKRENRRYLQFFFSSKIGRSASRLNIKINCNDFSENLAYIRTCTSLADGTDNNLLIEGSWTFLESSACVARDAITIPPSRHDCINGYLLSSSKVGSQKTNGWMMRNNEINCSYRLSHFFILPRNRYQNTHF